VAARFPESGLAGDFQKHGRIIHQKLILRSCRLPRLRDCFQAVTPEHSTGDLVEQNLKIPFARLSQRRGARAALYVAAAYAGAYAVLSLCGQYRNNVGSLDRLGIHTRGISDLEEWQPAGVIVAHFPAVPGEPRLMTANVLGYCFLPLVMIDQQYCHATKPIRFGS
jgi:hypothetical protein